MECPKCGGTAKTYESAKTEEVTAKRHKCRACHYRFYTVEKMVSREEGIKLFAEARTIKGKETA